MSDATPGNDRSDRNELKARFRLMGPSVPKETVTVTRQGLRVGRTADNDLTLAHREISRLHMRIIWRENAYFAEDLNSSNGVFLNDERLRARVPTRLQEGDTIRLGPYTLRLESLYEDQIIPRIPTPPRPPEIGLSTNGATPEHPPGIPVDRSTWLNYLPAIYGEDDFIARYLLIFESIMQPIIWRIDNFDFYLSPEVAPDDWLHWMSEWFDVLLIEDLPEDRKRAVVAQLGWLFLRRGTPAGLSRLLELYFGVQPEIIEPRDRPCYFIVRMPLSASDVLSEQPDLARQTVTRLVESQKPAFAAFSIEFS